MGIEIGLGFTQWGIGELEVAEGSQRVWKLVLVDPDTGITISAHFNESGLADLHERSRADAGPEVVVERPKLVIPKGKLRKH